VLTAFGDVQRTCCQPPPSASTRLTWTSGSPGKSSNCNPHAQAFKRFERAGWTEVAARYHEAFSRLTQQAIDPLLDAAGVGAGMRVLDVATGPGHAADAAARRGATPIGIDFSETMVAEARRHYPHLEFRAGHAESLAFGDAEFDAVVCNFGMLHFAEPERAAAEAFRVLKPGGCYAFTVWDAPERAATFGLVLRAVESQGNLDVSLPPGPRSSASATRPRRDGCWSRQASSTRATGRCR